ncbi:MAG: GspMb/PilO family protein [Acidobacteriota bacterium]
MIDPGNGPSGHLGSRLRRWLVGGFPGILAIVALLLANLAAFGLWTLPRWRARSTSGSAAGQLEAARRLLQPRLLAARDSYGKVLTAENDLDSLADLIVSSGGGAELMGILQAAAREAGIAVESAAYQPAVIEELGLVELGIALPVEGSYRAVRRLLDKLTQGDDFLIVQSVALAPAPQGSSPELLRVDLALSAFLPNPESLPLGAELAPTSDSRPAADSARGRRTVAASVAPAATVAAASPLSVAEALSARLASLPPLPVEPSDYELHLARLQRPTAAALTTSRNLFAFFRPAPPPSEERPAAVEEEPEEAEPEIALRLVGVLQVGGHWYASLSDGDDIYVGAAGTRLTNGFEILEVGADYAEVAAGDLRARLTLEGMGP